MQDEVEFLLVIYLLNRISLCIFARGLGFGLFQDILVKHKALTIIVVFQKKRRKL